MKKRLLITGGSGFVGGHLIRITQPQYEVHATFLKNPLPNDKIFSHQIDLSQVSQLDDLLSRVCPNAIIHAAAISNPDFCEQNQEHAMKVNVKATEVLASWAERNQARFIFTSTDMVFDGERGYYQEDDAPNPISNYARSKVAAENRITGIRSNFVIARVALVYGFGVTRPTSFFENMVINLKSENEVTLFHDQYRSPILVTNLAEALLELVEHDFVGVLHIGGTERISRWDFGVKACQILNLPDRYLVKKSMYDFNTLAPRPRDISFFCDLAIRVLKIKLLNCDEGLSRLRQNVTEKS